MTLTENTSGLARFCQQGLGFDSLYSWLLVKPYCALAKLNRKDIFDQLMMLNAWYISLWHDVLASSQNGKLRWYASAIGLATLLLLLALLLTVNVGTISMEAS